MWCVVRVGVAGAAAFGAWAFVVNRVVIQWVDSPWKTPCMAVLGLALGAFVVGSALRGGRANGVWLLLLALLFAGELRRGWLRHRYQADSRHTAAWPAVTTATVETRSFRLDFPELAAGRVRVLHLTDLHVGPAQPSALLSDVERRMRELEPDLVFLTGDYLSHADRLPALADFLTRLPRARYGAYAVLGNHDYWTGRPDAVQSTLERAGVRIVAGRCVDVPTDGGALLAVCGTEAPWGPPLGTPARTRARLRLALSHTPDNVFALSDLGMSAVFAGHTHAGQFRIPFLGAVLVPSDHGRLFDEGHFVVGTTHLFVSAGIGADAPPLRLWCPAELVVVDLIGRPESTP